MNALVSVLLVLLAQVASPPVADPVAKAKAQAVLKEGTALYERGDFAAALDRFETAYGIFPSPKLQFNIGQADRSLGRPLEAVEAFEKFLAQVPDAAPELLSEARQSVVELRGKLGQLNIECATPGAEVAMDGKSVGKTPLAQPVWTTPGRHQVTTRQPGYGPAVVNVTAGQIQTVSLEPRWLPSPATEATAAQPPPILVPASRESAPGSPATGHSQEWWSGRSWYVWAAAGGTVVFATAAIVAGLSANSRFNELQSSCGATTAGCSESQIDSVKSRATLTDVLWVLAGASAVATGVSFYVDSREAGVSVALTF